MIWSSREECLMSPLNITVKGGERLHFEAND